MTKIILLLGLEKFGASIVITKYSVGVDEIQ